jgi:DNA-binding winged helix-turn-helix (wHTH) protein/WD40 repeat protein
MPVGEKQIFRFGPFQLDTQCGQLRRDGLGLKLQGQPVQILESLLEKRGQLVTREELREQLWASNTFVDFDHSLNTAIKKLRQALGDEADTPRYIETLPRRGYRFIGEVSAEGRVQNSGAEPLVDEGIIDKVATTLADAAINVVTDSRRAPRRVLWLVATAAALLAIAAAVYWSTKPAPPPRIVGSHALTHTGYQKEWSLWGTTRLVADVANVYFVENRPSGPVLMRAAVNGKGVSELPVAIGPENGLRDITKDGSELLLGLNDFKEDREDAWIQPLLGGPARLVAKDTRWARFTPGNDEIIFSRGDRDLYRVRIDGTDTRLIVAGLPGITELAISPDERRIRFGVEPGDFLWEVGSDGSNPHRILSEHEAIMKVGNWSPDGKYFFFTSWSGDRRDLWVLPEKKGWFQNGEGSPIQLTFGPMSIESPLLGGDNQKVYVTGLERHGELTVYDSEAGRFVPYLDGLPACYVDFSRDGLWMAYVSYPEGSLWRSRVDGSERRQLTVPPMAIINPRWSPDGKLIAFNEFANGDRSRMGPFTTRRIYAISRDGGGPMLLAGDVVADAAWSRDGGSIVYARRTPDGQFELDMLDLKSQTTTIVPGSTGMVSPRWSPDGKYLAAMKWPNTKLTLFDIATQRWSALLEGGVFAWPSWSRDSKFVYVQEAHQRFIVRVGVKDHRREQIASLKELRSTAYYYWSLGWFGLTPDDRILTTRDTGVEEIYAFDLKYK